MIGNELPPPIYKEFMFSSNFLTYDHIFFYFRWFLRLFLRQ